MTYTAADRGGSGLESERTSQVLGAETRVRGEEVTFIREYRFIIIGSGKGIDREAKRARSYECEMSEALDPFPTTRWSLVLKAKRSDPESKRALDDLCRAYWSPLLKTAQRRGYSSHEAEDLVQGFFQQVLDKELFSRACPEKGKLRASLQTAFRHHLLFCVSA